ncbi:neuroguidin-like protein [Achlya hypogyna]|uniref:Serine protease n=1 Tax=Achlya hypogyna TaxID=1202772 RepID=A0A1V9Z7V0_ACHHY|nr:neuroguidin-like protein [Achlya hypogyna]
MLRIVLWSIVLVHTVAGLTPAGDLTPYNLVFYGDAPFRWVIRKPKATYTAVHFQVLQVPPNATVRLANDAGTRVVTYHGGESLTNAFAEWIGGDSVTLSFEADVYVRQATPVVVVDKVAYGRHASALEKICGNDNMVPATCMASTSKYKPSRAVARLLIQGIGWCTGWLLGSEGHVVTNEHCVGINEDGRDFQVELGAECPCDDPQNAVSWACQGTIVATNATFLLGDEATDFALLKMNVKPGVHLADWGYLQVRESGAKLHEEIYIPGHPVSKPKRISAVLSDGMAGVVVNASVITAKGEKFSYLLDTDEGNSGSPVISSSDNVVVGLHNAGSCDERHNSGVKMDRIDRRRHGHRRSCVRHRFPRTMEALSKVENDIKMLQEKLGEFHDTLTDSLPTDGGMSLLQIKNHALMQYSQLSMFFTLLKLESPDEVSNHPVFKELVRYRTIIERMRPLDRKLKYQVDKLLKIAVSDSKTLDETLSYAPNPAALKADEDEDDEEADEADGAGEKKSDGVYRAPRMASVPYDEEEKEAEKKAKREERNRKRLAKSTILSEVREEYSERPQEILASGSSALDKELAKEAAEKTEYEEERFVRLVTSRKDKIRKRQRERDAMAADSIGKIDNFAGIHEALGDVAKGQSKGKYIPADTGKKVGGRIGGIFSHLDTGSSKKRGASSSHGPAASSAATTSAAPTTAAPAGKKQKVKFSLNL